MADTIRKDLGGATAYAAAVAGGYTGTRQEFEALMASYAHVAEQAEASAQAAAASAQTSNDEAEKSEAYAKGTVDGTPVESGETGYHDNADYYRGLSAASATESSGHASNALGYQRVSERYAKGTEDGNPVSSGTGYNDNSNYYRGLAAESATAASGSANNAGASALKSEGWAEGTQNGTPVTSESPYYEHNAKYWAEQAEATYESIPEDYTELSDEVNELNNTIAQLPTEATGQALLTDETVNTILLVAALDNIDSLIENLLPQDDTAENIVTELQTENEWLEIIYLEATERLEETV